MSLSVFAAEKVYFAGLSFIGDDKDMLEDLIAAAMNDAVHSLEATTKDKYADLTSGMSLPPGMKLPF